MKRALSVLMCAVLLAVSLPIDAFAEELLTIEIYSAEDLIELSENCVLDTWSAGKNVVLCADVDLTGVDFEPIAQFAGSFDGGGHTISGLSITSEISTVGLFRKILEGGIVTDLKVEGEVLPSGEGTNVGGIAGENNGTIDNCSFEGSVSGVTAVGGIAGLNNGVVDGCTSRGIVVGEHRVGGIAGDNAGTVTGSKNYASVNNEYISGSSASFLSSIFDLGITTEEVINITDIGGIAGYSSGVVTGCVNSGTIGYSGLGYNVGGVAGRQSGYISSSVNYGDVVGKKDVGGISGQIEPEAKWSFGAGLFDDLEDAIDILESSVDELISNADDSITDAGDKLDAVMDSMSDVGDAAETLSYDAEDWINENIDTINEIFDRIDMISEELEPVMDDIEDAFSYLESSMDSLTEALEDLDDTEDELEDAFGLVESAIDTAGLAVKKAKLAAANISDAMEHIASSVGAGENPAEGYEELAEGFSELAMLVRDISDALIEGLSGYTPSEEDGVIGAVAEFLYTMAEALPEVSESLELFAEASTKMVMGLVDIIQNLDPSELIDSLDDFEAASANLAKAMAYLNDAAGDLTDSFEYFKDAGDSIEYMTDDLIDTSSDIEKAFDSLESMAERLEDLFSELNDEAEIEFTTLDTESESQTRLWDSLDALNDSVSALGDSITEGELVDYIDLVSDALENVVDVIIEIVDDLTSTEEVEYKDDISYLGVKEGTSGTLLLSENYGAVTADSNAGGIVGAMTIDVSFDLEDELDISSLISGTASYIIYAVVSDCVNGGEITATNCAGGIAGKMDYGAIISCISGGTVTADESYAGGIVGSSEASVKNSLARVKISASSYAGGIAGLGEDISGCLAMPHFDENCEYIGSIAGYSEGTLSSNYYAECSIGAVDGFSYDGEAQKTSYEELLSLAGDADIFKFVTVTFLVDGDVYDTIKAEFGDKISELPSVPETESSYWAWDEEVLEALSYDMTVTGEYVDKLTTISTGESIPLALCEGSFYGGQAFTAQELTPSEGASWAYTFSVSDYDDALIIRLRTESEGVLTLLGTDTEVNYERDGSYIVFTVQNGSSVEMTEAAEKSPVYLIVGIAAAVVVVALIAVLVIKRKKAPTGDGESTDPDVESSEKGNGDEVPSEMHEESESREKQDGD